MASTFVEITREDFEDWLNQSPFRWKRDPRYAGVYILLLSKHVGISIRSTVGESGQAKGKGSASGAMRLVSVDHGHTLNKKDMGQSHFARTTNWRVNWKKGVNALVDAYDRSPSFYDAFAQVPDRDAYKKQMLAEIETIHDWPKDVMLASYHDQVSKGGILTEKQRELLEQRARKPAPRPEKPSVPVVDDERLDDLRKLWVAAKRAGDSWLMDFAKSIADQLKAGRSLSPKQSETVRHNLDKYKVANVNKTTKPSARKVASLWLKATGSSWGMFSAAGTRTVKAIAQKVSRMAVRGGWDGEQISEALWAELRKASKRFPEITDTIVREILFDAVEKETDVQIW